MKTIREILEEVEQKGLEHAGDYLTPQELKLLIANNGSAVGIKP